MQASYYLKKNTFIGSVFMLLAIFFLYDQMGTTDYRSLCSQQYERKLPKIDSRCVDLRTSMVDVKLGCYTCSKY